MNGLAKLEMVLEAVDKATRPIRNVENAIGKLEGKTRRSTGVMRKLGNVGAKAMRAIGKAAKVAAVAGVVALTGAVTDGIARAADMEAALADANKTLQLDPAGLESLSDGLSEISTRIPVAKKGLVEIAGVAGRMGIRGEESLLKFAELSATMSFTFDVTTERAAEMMGSWREQTGWTMDELELFADQINWFGNNTAASEAGIAEYASRVLDIGLNAGLAKEEILALGAAMQAKGRDPSVAATGLRATLRALQKGDAISESQAAVYKDLGLDPSGVQKQLAEDGAEAIITVVDAISKLDEAERGAAASILFGDEAYRAMGGLLTDVEALRAALGRIDDMGDASGTMFEEFSALADTTLANWQKVKNVINGARVDVGMRFLPTVNSALKSFLQIFTTLNERATVFDRVGTAVRGFVTGFQSSFEGATAAGEAFTQWAEGVGQRIHEFLFGTADAENTISVLSGIFADAEAAGERFGAAIQATANTVSAAWTTVETSWGAGRELFASLAEAIVWPELPPFAWPAIDRLDLGALIDRVTDWDLPTFTWPKPGTFSIASLVERLPSWELPDLTWPTVGFDLASLVTFLTSWALPEFAWPPIGELDLASLVAGIDAWPIPDAFAWPFVAALDLATSIALPDWDAITSAASTAWSTIETAWGAAKGFFNGIFGTINEPNLTPLTDAATTAWDAIVTVWDGAAAFFDGVASGIEGALANVAGPIEANLGTVGSVLSDALGTIENIAASIASAFGEGTGARGALEWLGSVTIDAAGIAYGAWQTAIGELLDPLQELTSWIEEKSGALDFTGLIPETLPDFGFLDGVKNALKGFTNWIGGVADLGVSSLKSWAEGYFEGFSEYMGPIGEKLTGITEQVGPILANVGSMFTSLGNALSTLAANDGVPSTINAIATAIGRIVGFTANASLDAIEGIVTFLRGLTDMIAGLYAGDYEAAFAPVQELFDWLGGLTIEKVLPDLNVGETIRGWFDFEMPTFDDLTASVAGVFEGIDPPDIGALFSGMWAALPIFPGWSAITGAFKIAFSWREALPTFEWANILPDLPDAIRNLFTSEPVENVEQAVKRIREIAERGANVGVVSFEVEEAFPAIDALEKGTATIEETIDRLQSLDLGRMDTARIQEMVSALNEIGGATGSAEAAVAGQAQSAAAKVSASVETVRAAASDIEALQSATSNVTSQLDTITGQAGAIPGAVNDAIGQIETAVAGVNLTTEGMRIIGSLASGMRTASGGVTAAAAGAVTGVRMAVTMDLSYQGRRAMDTFAAGIRARASVAVAEVKQMTQAIRDHLPSSPAKVGPLSDLHRLKFAETIAGSVRPAPLVRAVRDMSEQARTAASLGAIDVGIASPRRLGMVSGPSRRLGTPLQRERPGFRSTARAAEVARSGASSIDASFHHHGDVNFRTEGDKREFAELLRTHRREVARVAKEENRRERRLKF